MPEPRGKPSHAWIGLKPPENMRVSLDDITVDPVCFPYPPNDDRVDEFCRLAGTGTVKFPPVLTVLDPAQGRHYLVDGRHRFLAARRMMTGRIGARVYTGTLPDAVLLAMRYDRSGDTRRRIDTMLDACPDWSGRMVIQWLGCPESPVYERIRERKAMAMEASKPPCSVPDHVDPAERTDRMGYVGPHQVAGAFTRHRDAVNKVAKQVRAASRALGTAKRDNAVALSSVSDNQIKRRCEELNEIARYIELHLPYAVCPYCNGRGRSCRSCGERGWLTEQEWKLTDETMRLQREKAILLAKEKR